MRRKATSPQSRTDAARVDRLRDEDIDLSDLPEISPQEFARGLVRQGLKPVALKSQITLRIDADVVEWFRARGAGYQSQMNAVLKAYKAAHDDRAKSTTEPKRRKSAAADIIDEDFVLGGRGHKSLSSIVREERPPSLNDLLRKKKRS